MEGVLLAKEIWLKRMQLFEEAKKDPLAQLEADKLKAAAQEAEQKASREAALGQEAIARALFEQYGQDHAFGHQAVPPTGRKADSECGGCQ
jgi:hypothetical protein